MARERRRLRMRLSWPHFTSVRLADLAGLQALRAARDLELHAIAVGEGPEAGPLDRRIVDEDVAAPVLRDESETTSFVEPLHGSLLHFIAPLGCHTRCRIRLRAVSRPRWPGFGPHGGESKTKRPPAENWRSRILARTSTGYRIEALDARTLERIRTISAT